MNPKHAENYQKLGLNVVHYRKLRKLTQENLAESINKERNTISNIECAATGVSLDTLFDIAEALEIPIHKLFEFRD